MYSSLDHQLIPIASVFMVLEQVIRIYQRKDLTRIQDLVTNVGSSIIFLFSRYGLQQGTFGVTGLFTGFSSLP